MLMPHAGLFVVSATLSWLRIPRIIPYKFLVVAMHCILDVNLKKILAHVVAWDVPFVVQGRKAKGQVKNQRMG